MSKLNPYKILRTGDIVVDKTTGIKGKIHYVIEHGGQMSFQKEVSGLEAVQFDDGNKITIIPIERIILKK
jgi:hypothetical protein